MNPGISRGRLLAATAVVCLAAVVMLAWLFWPSAPPIPGAQRVRQYSNVRACLLTGADGLAGSVAAAAWSGMEQASISSKAMVSYLPVPWPASKAAALTYLASLVQRQCSVIVAVGPAQVAVAASQAGKYRHVHFIVITAGGARATSAVIRVSAGSAAHVHAAVQAAVSAAVSGQPTGT